MTPDPELDADRLLALSYIPARRRPAVEALWRLDAALGRVLAGGREPMISQIKLAWWRDSLERLDTSRAPAEPALQAAAAQIVPAGVSGAELANMEQGWAVLLTQEPLDPDELKSYAVGRGSLLFRYTARLLGVVAELDHEQAGEGWALADLARHSNEVDARAALEAAALPDVRWPAALRPLGMLAALAARDKERGFGNFEPHGAPRRMARMFRHWLTGR